MYRAPLILRQETKVNLLGFFRWDFCVATTMDHVYKCFFCCISRLPALFVGPVFIIELRCAHVLPELKYVCNFNSQLTFDNAFSILCIGGSEGRWIDPPLLLDPRLRRAPLSWAALDSILHDIYSALQIPIWKRAWSLVLCINIRRVACLDFWKWLWLLRPNWCLLPGVQLGSFFRWKLVYTD